jgi:GTPase
MTKRCGHVAVIGAPNAGKSTLVNALVGQKVAIVSPKAQTTRVRLMGVAMEGETQIILVDTPGIFAPNRRLDRAMVAAAWEGAQEADLILAVVDGRAGAGPKVEKVFGTLKDRPERKWLLLNKVDIAAKDKLLSLTTKLLDMCEFERILYISAETGEAVAELKAAVAAEMPEGDWHYPEDQISDATERLMPAPSRPKNMSSAPMAVWNYTSKSLSNAKASARLSLAKAARGSNPLAPPPAKKSPKTWV